MVTAVWNQLIVPELLVKSALLRKKAHMFVHHKPSSKIIGASQGTYGSQWQMESLQYQKTQRGRLWVVELRLL